MVLQLPPKLKDDDRLTLHDLPAVEQFAGNDVMYQDVTHEDEAPLVERGTLMSLNPKQLPQTIVNHLSALLAPEHLAGPLKLIYRPIFIGAIGLHALLLFAPGAKHEEKKEVKEKEKPVTITQIATGKAAPKKLNKLPTVKLPPVKPTLPKLTTPTNQAPAIEKPKAEPETVKKPDEPKTEQKTPPAAAAPPNQKETPLPPGGAKAGDPFEKFNINYPGATPSGTFYRASGADTAAVEAFFKGQSDFTIQAGSSSTPARKILEISTKDGKKGYLGIFANGSETVYTGLRPSESEIPADIGALKVEKALPGGYPDTFKTIAGIDGGGVSPEDFPDYSLYWTAKTIADGAEWKFPVLQEQVYDDLSVAVAESTLMPQLQSQFKQIEPIAGGYGGGTLYRMTGASGEYFLNILAKKEGVGAIVLTMDRDPRK
jgi:outer membrane biosynthesis protein TonB